MKARPPNADASFTGLLQDLTETATKLFCDLPVALLSKTVDTCGGTSSAGSGCTTATWDACGDCGGAGCASCIPVPVPIPVPVLQCGDDACWPCWLPRRLAPICESVCPGSVLRVRFPVTNLSNEERRFIVAATGEGSRLAAGSPSSVLLGPMGDGELVAVIRVPANFDGQRIRLSLWVRGCLDHVVPVTIVADGECCGVIATRSVVEQPDTCHTWRDHFYVSRPCRPARSETKTGSKEQRHR